MLVLCKVNDKIVSQCFWLFGQGKANKVKKDKITFFYYSCYKKVYKNKHVKHEYMLNYYVIQKPCNCIWRKDIFEGAFDFENTL